MDSHPLPPVPKNHVDALLRQNELSVASRAVLALAWGGAPNGEHEISVGTDMLSDSQIHLDFWENGSIAPLPQFNETVAEAKSNPELFTRQKIVDISAFITPINGDFNHCLSTVYSMPESEAIVQLDEYLTTVIEASKEDNSEIYNKAVGLQEQLGYLDEARFEEGIEALAQIWTKYLSVNPKSFINLVTRENVKTPKSFEYMLGRLKGRVAEIDLGAALRVIDFPEGWRDTTGSKLVILDDWVISGKTASKMVTGALKQIHEQKLENLYDSIEVHSVAREATADTIPGVRYRSIYLHDSGTDYDTVSMTGSHSSVNYGFEYPLREMQKYLQKKGVFIEAPLLMATEPTTYRDIAIRRAINSDPEGKILLTVAGENGHILETLGEIFRLERQIYSSAVNEDETQRELSRQERRKILDKIVSMRVDLKQLAVNRGELRQELGLKRDKV